MSVMNAADEIALVLTTNENVEESNKDNVF